jgi:anti-sigma regulatory factor (Ser/Thr protein kinase)
MHMARPSGRGLFLMRTFMTEVKYNEAGNEVLLVHRRAGV